MGVVTWDVVPLGRGPRRGSRDKNGDKIGDNETRYPPYKTRRNENGGGPPVPRKPNNRAAFPLLDPTQPEGYARTFNP